MCSSAVGHQNQSERKIYVLNLARKYEYEKEKIIKEILIFHAKRIIPK